MCWKVPKLWVLEQSYREELMPSSACTGQMRSVPKKQRYNKIFNSGDLMRNNCINFSRNFLLTGLLPLILMLSGCAAIGPSSSVKEDVAKLNFQIGHGPYSFECDAPEGRYQESNISVSGDKLHAAGAMRFLELRSHPGWAASATVTFAGPTRKRPFLGLQALIMPDEPNSIQFAITGKGDAQERTVFAVTPVTDAWIPFEVKLSRAGDLEVSIASQTTKMVVSAFEPSRLSLFCSTASVNFSNVIVENAR